MKFKFYQRISSQFKTISTEPVPDSLEAQIDEEFDSVWRWGVAEIDKIWDVIRVMTIKGLAAGSMWRANNAKAEGDRYPKMKSVLILVAFMVAILARPEILDYFDEINNPKDMVAEIAKKYEQTSETQIQQQAVRDDFYGKYPELNKPDIHPIVLGAAKMTAQQLGKTKWDAELRDKTAQRVKAILNASDAIGAKYSNTKK